MAAGLRSQPSDAGVRVTARRHRDYNSIRSAHRDHRDHREGRYVTSGIARNYIEGTPSAPLCVATRALRRQLFAGIAAQDKPIRTIAI
jgi:hypothetical protein